MLTSAYYTLASHSLPFLLLAQAEEEAGRGYAASVAILLLCIVLGMLLTVAPSKREEKVKKLKQD